MTPTYLSEKAAQTLMVDSGRPAANESFPLSSNLGMNERTNAERNELMNELMYRRMNGEIFERRGNVMLTRNTFRPCRSHHPTCSF